MINEGQLSKILIDHCTMAAYNWEFEANENEIIWEVWKTSPNLGFPYLNFLGGGPVKKKYTL